jgi:hypothetical protein
MAEFKGTETTYLLLVLTDHYFPKVLNWNNWHPEHSLKIL